MRWAQWESLGYWTVFVAAFLGVAMWESHAEKRRLTIPAALRWKGHGLLVVINAIVSTLTLRVSPVFAAVFAERNPFGLLRQSWMPFLVSAILTVLALDLVKYGVHLACHRLPWLWRVHQVHHSDPDFDVSTAARAHPLEVLWIQGSLLATILLLAPPPIAVFAAELIACFQSFFEHANASLPAWAEKALRPWIVTPDLHRVHHTNQIWEQQRNLGEVFPWWDRMFGTYSAEPRGGEATWEPGLEGLAGPHMVTVGFLLKEPLDTPPAM